MSQEKHITIDVVQENGRYRAALPEVKVFATNTTGGPRTDSRPKHNPGSLPREATQGFRWAPWGVNDCLPSDIRRKIEKVPIAGRVVQKKAQMLYGNGLAYYRNKDLQENPSEVRRAYVPTVEKFLRTNKIATKWLVPQIGDYCYLINAFSEFILSMDKTMITGIYHKTGEFCRLSEQNERNNNIEYIYYSPDFALGYPPPDSRIRKIRLLPWYDQDRFLQSIPGFKFAYHTKYEMPGYIYYPKPFWVGLYRENGWMDAAAAVPEIVNSMMRNQVQLKYQIVIPESYFEIRHSEWFQYTDEQKEDIIDELITKINNSLSGTTNAFQSITTVTRSEVGTGEAMGRIEIIALDDKIKKDSWVPSSNAADHQITVGHGLHPSLVGLANEGGKMGAGSGSDTRENFNSEITVNTIEQDIILEPLNFVAEYNAKADPDWDVTFFIDHTFHTTTNNQETGIVPSDTTRQIQ